MIEAQVSQCGICSQDLQENLMYYGCHTFHSDCVKKYLQAYFTLLLSTINTDSFPIKCPQEGCSNSLDFQAIRFFQNTELEDKFLEYGFRDYLKKNSKYLIQCPTPDCTYVVEYELLCQMPAGPNKVLGKKCQVCSKYFCRCKREINCQKCSLPICVICKSRHVGLSCYQHAFNLRIDPNFNAFVKFIKQASFRKCPQCNFWVERSAGCNHMTCRCGYQFCYKCNGKYMACSCVDRSIPNQVNYPKEVRAYKPSPAKKQKPIPKIQKERQVLKPVVFQFFVPRILDLTIL